MIDHCAPAAGSRIALVGAGAIAGAVVQHVKDRPDAGRIGAALVRRLPVDAAFTGMTLFRDVEDLLAWRPDLVVECAGHEAVRTLISAVLTTGTDVIVASVGALADPDLLDRLQQIAKRSGAHLIVPSGAIGGLDALQAAQVAGLSHVAYVGRKPPRAWKGTPAEATYDLDRLEAPVILFEGSAAEAARLYPKNANVVMAVALAGRGPESTSVRLIADPEATTNRHEVRASGAFGDLCFTIANQPLPDNPKSSLLAALSVVQAIRRWHAALVI